MLYVYGGWAGLVGKRGNPPSHIPSEGEGMFEEMGRGEHVKHACWHVLRVWWMGWVGG